MWKPLKVNLTREDVVTCLQFILEGKPYVLGDFTDVPIQDPELDKIRLHILSLETSYPPENSESYLNLEGQKVLQTIIQELRDGGEVSLS